ncbi:DUF4157 domain-containing protein [Streptomyces sp. NBC_00038]|uniref:eCIS core domain-containing protein n=1 Tax=Streptomyces sp. NBC_00038 TaxID=2903615 RepID=UPI002254DF73|nr:DUF4157 domain-containing protein [Streptomyces sp. NBC_00038]MCX5561516.1 DUF4157 domain-containing protein [Streptomyces sp. NBC_00038]
MIHARLAGRTRSADPASAGPRSLADTSRGRPLDPVNRAFTEPLFGQDFSQVRVHTDERAAESARSLGALAYTVGQDIVFGANQYQPHDRAGRSVIAHELAHVVQQRARPAHPAMRLGIGDAGTAQEAAADRAADAVAHGEKVPSAMPTVSPTIQRKVEMRDVGPGQQSGFDRLQELVDRLNSMAEGGTFSAPLGGITAYRVRADEGTLVRGSQTVELEYQATEGRTPTFFETRMQAFIDGETVLPLRLTNRHGLLGDKALGFHDRVEVDEWQSGYVDVDDLLASSDLALQSQLLHFLTERSATRNYAARIGGGTLLGAEFDRKHDIGIKAEAELLRDFFGDPTIQLLEDSPRATPTVLRVFRNSRRDRILHRIRQGHGADHGVDASTIEVITRDGATLTADEYRRLLEEERVERQRLRGAPERFEGGRPVPAP